MKRRAGIGLPRDQPVPRDVRVLVHRSFRSACRRRSCRSRDSRSPAPKSRSRAAPRCGRAGRSGSSARRAGTGSPARRACRWRPATTRHGCARPRRPLRHRQIEFLHAVRHPGVPARHVADDTEDVSRDSSCWKAAVPQAVSTPMTVEADRQPREERFAQCEVHGRHAGGSAAVDPVNDQQNAPPAEAR